MKKSKSIAEVRGPARLDKKTKKLTERLAPGDIAVIDHGDLDEVAAESLVLARVCAVVNAADSMTGRYPNKGPLRLAAGNVLHLDRAGPAIFEQVREGEELLIRGNHVYAGGRLVARCRLVDDELIKECLAVAEKNLDSLLADFVQNTMEYALAEKELVLGKIDFPGLATRFAGRHVLVVVRGQAYREDLRTIRHYIAEVKPILMGVDGGADALLEFGFLPHVVIGDMDSVSDRALTLADDVVVHAYPDGRAPGLERVGKLGVPYHVLRAPGTSEDIALLMAYELGAKLIAAVGTHSSMIDFLEKGRKGMASTFLVRLKVGNRLVDARGISQLYRGGISGRSLVMLAVAAAIPVLALVFTNSTVRHFFRLVVMRYGLF